MTGRTRSTKCGDPDVFLSIGDIVRGIYGDFAPVTLQAMRQIRWLLSQDISIISISSIVEAGVVPRFVEFLTYDHNPKLQWQSARILTDILSSLSEEAHAHVVVTAGAIPQLINCLSSEHNCVKGQAAWALGCIAGEATLRDEVIKHGVVKPLIQMIDSSNLTATYLFRAVWTLHNLCKKHERPPPFDEVKAFIPTIAKLLNHTDAEIIDQSSSALLYLTDGSDQQIEEVITITSIVPRLVQLMKHECGWVTVSPLGCIANVLGGTVCQKQVVLNCRNALPSLVELLDHPLNWMRMDACRSLYNVMEGTPDQIQAVLDNNLIETIIQKFEEGQPDVQEELRYVLLKLMTGGTMKQLTSVLRLIPGFRKVLPIEQAQKYMQPL